MQKCLQIDFLTDFFFYIFQLNMIFCTHHKAVAIFDEDVACAAVAFEKALQIALAHSVGQTAHIHSRSHHDNGSLRIWSRCYKIVKYIYIYQQGNRCSLQLLFCSTVL